MLNKSNCSPVKGEDIEQCRIAARKLLHKWKNITENYEEEHYKIVSLLMGKVEENVFIENPFLCDYGKNIFIGKNTYINKNCVFLDNDVIEIGENCLLAPSVQIMTSYHPVDAGERIIYDSKGKISFTSFTKQVVIGDNVWIGAGAIILPGVTIGNNSVIGAGSIVTKDIPDNVLAFGIPCKIIKNL